MESIQLASKSLAIPDADFLSSVKLAIQAASAPSPVLIVGESGTGKEMVARLIHTRSDRHLKPFVSVNCAAIPEGLIESELFGFERGAFTGAVQRKLGKFEQANHGVLLLDEISEMPWYLQAKLLRVLQEQELDRLGGEDSIPLDVKIIATTNQDPEQLIRMNKFRMDLFYRLNVVRIDLKPLRERPRSTLTLTRFFMEEISKQLSKKIEGISDSALQKLMEYPWPGNVRELRNAIERAILLTERSILEESDFEFLHSRQEVPRPVRLSDLEREHILKTLKNTQGNKTRTAEVLGISVRTLRNKLKEYGPCEP